MINLIITGHGRFASGLFNAVEQVIGPQLQVVTVDFMPEMSTQQLDEQLKQALESLPAGSGTLFFTDLIGGSPFRSSVLLSQALPASDVIAGTNLQMLAEMMMERDEIDDVKVFAAQALACGKQGILNFRSADQSKPATDDFSDGI
jgi:PTS system N-acetylgalactosamine-specific IIA component